MTLRHLGHDVTRTRAGEQPPASDLAICDVEHGRSRGRAPRCSVRRALLGFGSHEQPQALRRAREAGFDRVVARSAIAERLPALVDELTRDRPVSRPLELRSDPEMTYIITEPCIDVKDKSCIDVCPVDCIHESDRMLVIDPEECIDCGACEPECPVEAIFPEDAVPDKWEPFIKINYAYRDSIAKVNELVEEQVLASPPPQTQA